MKFIRERILSKQKQHERHANAIFRRYSKGLLGGIISTITLLRHAFRRKRRGVNVVINYSYRVG